jgi:hypothetical protein
LPYPCATLDAIPAPTDACDVPTSETVGVRIEVLGIERVHGCGKLIAVANVQIDVYDISLVLQGCQIRTTDDGKYLAQAPRWRHPHDGKWIVGPKSLTDALGAELIEAIQDMTA